MLGRVLVATSLGNDMRGQDPGFAAHVALYEARHGSLTADGLAIATQANYLCWFEAGFPHSLLSVCSAIGSGRPGRIRLCQQVAPEWWVELHHYVVATQRWLGDDRQAPGGVDVDRLDYIGALLGPPTPARRALAESYPATLADQLLYSVSLSVLGADGDDEPDGYVDHQEWYDRSPRTVAPECSLYRVGGDDLVASLTEAAFAALASESECGADLPMRLSENALGRSQPPCMHRYARCLDVRAASIGALKWRCGLPPDRRPSAHWAEVGAEASAAIDAWLAGAKPGTPFATSLHEALGERDAAKVDVVQLFLKEPPAGTTFWTWRLTAEASAGSMVWQLYGLPAPVANAE